MRSVIVKAAWLWIAVVSAGYGIHGCAARHRAPTALEIMGAAIDPAYAAVMDGCIAEQEEIAFEAETDALSVDEARVMIAGVRARCHKARDVFEAYRAMHAAAADALEHGNQAKAERLTNELKQAWKEHRHGQ